MTENQVTPLTLSPELVAETTAAANPPDARKPRHDGFTPEAIAAFLYALAETGVVERAAAAAGVSPQATYAFRNRRAGRAFGRVWDAVLIHRARVRTVAENTRIANEGCVAERRDGAGNVIGTAHYRDNRLSMAMLTRMDRLAEREGANDEHLRALSEDMEEFIDCVAEGGDPDAFVEARRPAPSEAEETETTDDPGQATLQALAAALSAMLPAPAAPAWTPPPQDHDEVWKEEDGTWFTNMPEPLGFKRYKEEHPDGTIIQRMLTPAEEEAFLDRRDDEDYARDSGDGFWVLVQGSFFPKGDAGEGREGPPSEPP
jgi:hypothetical protein